MPVSYQLAFFLGVIFQTFLVGLFVPLLVAASYAQWQKVSRGQKVNVVMGFTIVFFGLAIPVHWLLGLRRVIFAALYLSPGQTMEQYFQPPYPVDEIARWAVFQLLLVVGDLVMIHRLYHIYNKSILACIVPSMSTSGLIAIGFGLTNQLRNLNTEAENKALNAWTTACFCLTLFNNTLTSAAISYRLWRSHRETVAYAASAMNSESIVLRAMRVLVESAGPWICFVLINFFAFLSGSNLTYTFLDMTCPAVGISFCLIIVRLGTVAPEVREDSWECAQRSGTSRIMTDSRHSGLAVPLDRVKVDRDVYVNESESGIKLRVMSSTTSIPPDEKQSPVH